MTHAEGLAHKLLSKLCPPPHLLQKLQLGGQLLQLLCQQPGLSTQQAAPLLRCKARCSQGLEIEYSGGF